MKKYYDLLSELQNCYFHGAIRGFVHESYKITVLFDPDTDKTKINLIVEYLEKTYPHLKHVESAGFSDRLYIYYDFEREVGVMPS